jgi:DNA-binding GntR family transcriptional regulator
MTVVKKAPIYRSLAEEAYVKLLAAIQAGTFKPGTRMMETDMAAWLKMSRTPVRDALRKLENDGLLVHQPHVGAVIATLDHAAVMELYAMREVLEGTAAALAARHASEFDLAQLEELIAIEKSLQGNYEELSRHNRRFHHTIHQAAHNRYLLRSLMSVRDSLGLLGRSQMTIPQRAAGALKEHRDIVKAIRKRDPEAAEQAARTHTRSAQRERMKRFPPG